MDFFFSDSFDFEYGTVMLRISQGLDISPMLKVNGKPEPELWLYSRVEGFMEMYWPSPNYK